MAPGSGWKQQDFKIHIGDEIGGKRAIGRNKGTDFSTHAVCVDIDFNHTADGGSRTVSLVYADTSDGSLHERILSVDRKADDNFSQRFGGRKTARR